MDFFLRAKHWHLFLLIISGPLIFELFLIFTISEKLRNAEDPDLVFIVQLFRFFPVLFLFLFGILGAWYYSVASKMKQLLPPGISLNFGLFKFFLGTAILYFIGMSVFFMYIFESMFLLLEPPFEPVFILLIIPLHFFAVIGLFYSMFFVARAIKSAELKRKATFSECAAEFLMIWFFPIGIWFLQPKINRLSQFHTTEILSDVIDV